MANNQNLKPVQPGEVRNPKGKPKGTRNRSTIAKEVLEILATGGLTEPTVVALQKLLKVKNDE
jgi:hypothetical protein